MPERSDLPNFSAYKKSPFLFLFVLSVIFSVMAFYIYHLISANLATKMVFDNSTSFYHPDTPAPTTFPTPAATVTTEPTSDQSGYLVFSSSTDKFEVRYQSYRKLFQDVSSQNHRYVFTEPNSANFVVHVGQTWSWIHPNRQFGNDFKIADKPTFKYETTSQIVVDLENGGNLYTLQCVHNGNEKLKTECQEFMSSFKLL